jgi:sec-independent protein translocase protein TatA
MGFLENPLHLALLLVILLLVFGARRLPELGRSLGEGMRGFKDAISGESRDEPARLEAPPAGETQAAAAPSEPAKAPAPTQGPPPAPSQPPAAPPTGPN